MMRPPPPAFHMRDRFRHRCSVLSRFRIQCLLPGLLRQTEEISEGGPPGVGHQNIELPELGEGFLQELLDLGGDAHVSDDGHDLCSGFLANLFSGGGEFFFGSRANRESGTLPAKAYGNSLAQSGTGSADQRNLVF